MQAVSKKYSLGEDFTDTVLSRLPRKKFSIFARLRYELLLPREFSFDVKRAFFRGASVLETSFYFCMAGVFHFLIGLILAVFLPAKGFDYTGGFLLAQPEILLFVAIVFLLLGYLLKYSGIKRARLFCNIWLTIYISSLILLIIQVISGVGCILLFSLAPYIIICSILALFLFSVVERSAKRE